MHDLQEFGIRVAPLQFFAEYGGRDFVDAVSTLATRRLGVFRDEVLSSTSDGQEPPGAVDGEDDLGTRIHLNHNLSIGWV